jgi:hypothetical protein
MGITIPMGDLMRSLRQYPGEPMVTSGGGNPAWHIMDRNAWVLSCKASHITNPTMRFLLSRIASHTTCPENAPALLSTTSATLPQLLKLLQLCLTLIQLGTPDQGCSIPSYTWYL